MRASYQGQERTCRRCNQPGHQAKECRAKFCFNCEHVGHEAPDCVEKTLCSICIDSSHLAKDCPCGWIPPPVPKVSVKERSEAPPVPQPNEPDPQPSPELFSQSPPLQDLSSSSSSSSSSSESSSPASTGSPSFSTIVESLQENSSISNVDLKLIRI